MFSCLPHKYLFLIYIPKEKCKRLKSASFVFFEHSDNLFVLFMSLLISSSISISILYKHHSAYVKYSKHECAKNIYMEFKDTLKYLRKERGLTQKQLAEATNFSLSIINKWENGKKLPSYDALKTLARFFNVSGDEILGLE